MKLGVLLVLVALAGCTTFRPPTPTAATPAAGDSIDAYQRVVAPPPMGVTQAVVGTPAPPSGAPIAADEHPPCEATPSASAVQQLAIWRRSSNDSGNASRNEFAPRELYPILEVNASKHGATLYGGWTAQRPPFAVGDEACFHADLLRGAYNGTLSAFFFNRDFETLRETPEWTGVLPNDSVLTMTSLLKATKPGSFNFTLIIAMQGGRTFPLEIPVEVAPAKP